MGAGVHPRQLCLPQGPWRARRGGPAAAVHAPSHGPGTGEAFALQLDVRSYFNSIDKHILFGMLAARLDVRRLPDAEALWLCEQLVFHDCTQAPIFKGDPTLADKLPAHKTLFWAPAGKGLPIGNLNSQFFANVYFNALDQFVKHGLKCRCYLRYCDDFVLLSHLREQLLD